MFDAKNTKSLYRRRRQRPGSHGFAFDFPELLDISQQPDLLGGQSTIGDEAIQANENQDENQLHGISTNEKCRGTVLDVHFENLLAQLQAEVGADEAECLVSAAELHYQKVVEQQHERELVLDD